MNTAGSTVDTMLTILLSLADDRPENPQLLRQTGAQFVEATTVDGVDVEVFTGPAPTEVSGDGETATAGSDVSADSSDGQDASIANGSPAESRTRFWIDDDGRLRRFEARLGTATEWAVIDFDVDTTPDIDAIPGLLPLETTPTTSG